MNMHVIGNEEKREPKNFLAIKAMFGVASIGEENVFQPRFFNKRKAWTKHPKSGLPACRSYK